jgi:hypothetical protein
MSGSFIGCHAKPCLKHEANSILDFRFWILDFLDITQNRSLIHTIFGV